MNRFKGDIEDFKELQGILRNGLDQPFWKAVKKLLENWALRAQNDLLLVDPTDSGKIARLQEQIRLYRGLDPHLEGIVKEGEELS